MSHSVAQKARDALKVWLTRYPAIYDAARLPYSLARFAFRQPHDADYEAFGLFSGRVGVFLDVGANSGMSALSFRLYNQAMPIISIEPNEVHSRDLRMVSHFAQPHQFVICAAGRVNSSVTLHVPVYRGVPLTTEASTTMEEVTGSGSLRSRLGTAMDGPDFTVKSQVVECRRLDEFEVQPAFIKLDVQGAEYEVLIGLRRTIAEHSPILLVEAPEQRVADFLGKSGYSPFVYIPPSKSFEVGTFRTNVFFLNEEHVRQYLDGRISP